MTRSALYVSLADGDLLWEIRRAALDKRVSVRALVIRVLSDWLRSQGYGQSLGIPGERN
jgi:hypothetical protein